MIDIDKVLGFYDAMQTDMERKFPNISVRCEVCGHSEAADWSYLRSGWPKHHGQTMRLITEVASG